jgi:hypothetical protein
MARGAATLVARLSTGRLTSRRVQENDKDNSGGVLKRTHGNVDLPDHPAIVRNTGDTSRAARYQLCDNTYRKCFEEGVPVMRDRCVNETELSTRRIT